MSSVKIENSTLSLYIDDIENRGPIKKDTKCRSRLRKEKKNEEITRTVHNNIRYRSIDSDLLNIFVYIYMKDHEKLFKFQQLHFCNKYSREKRETVLLAACYESSSTFRN